MSTPTAAERAVVHILNRAQADPDLGYYMGALTESFDLLCAAEAELRKEPIEAVKKRRSKDLQPEYCRRRAEVLVRRDEAHKAKATLEEVETALEEFNSGEALRIIRAAKERG